MVNRKLIRPNLAELKEKMSSGRRSSSQGTATPAPRERENGGSGKGASSPRRRPAPPDQTSAEAFYYLKQMNNQTPMVVVLDNEEELRGHIEWYDRNCIKVHRDDRPNLLVFKHSIKYMFKQEEEHGDLTD